MDNKSPFGTICGVSVSGTIQQAKHIILLSVHLISDSGLNRHALSPSQAYQDVPIEWNGAGTMEYQCNLIRGVIVSITYSHDAEEGEDECRALQVSIVTHFKPHGWIKFADTRLDLDRMEHAFSLPDDIEDMQMSAVAQVPKSKVILENVYGKRLASEHLVRHHNPKKPRSKMMMPEEDIDNVAIQYNDVTQQRQIELDRIAALATRLKDEWETDLRIFCAGIFNASDRVYQLLELWHRHAPFKCANSSAVFSAFIDAILFSGFALTLSDSKINVFNAPELAIPLEFLTTTERVFCTRLYVNREELFGSVVSNGARQYRLRHFRLDATVMPTVICPRLIVHQFALDCIKIASNYALGRQILLPTLISAVGKSYVAHPRDLFLTRLKIALEKPSIYEAVSEMGMFVQIGLNETPEYESTALPLVRNARQRQPLQYASTPYRFSTPRIL